MAEPSASIPVSLPVPVLVAVGRYAADHGLSRSEVIRRAVTAFLGQAGDPR